MDLRGEHELTENIVHLVLAKIPGPDGKPIPGTKGISLFIVPKKLVDTDGELTGERNDVALAGLNHKLGYRGTTNTLLNFGEGKPSRAGQPGADRLPGRPAGRGPALHVPHDERGAHRRRPGRDDAGLCRLRGHPRLRAQPAAGPAITGRRQGRRRSRRCRIIEHADVKRMLLAQKAYVEGALALELYCARLVDEQHTGDARRRRDAGHLLLEVLTPDRQELAQRVVPGGQLAGHPGARRLRLHARLPGRAVLARQPPEHDPRRHARHPGAGPAGPQGRQDGGVGMRLLRARLEMTVSAAATDPELQTYGRSLERAFQALERAIAGAWANGDHLEALASATPFLRAFGHVVVAWIWLDLGVAAGRAALSARAQGMRQATRYFHAFELPKIYAWLGPVEDRSPVCRDMRDEWFDA